MKIEEWKTVLHNPLFEVSSYGRIRNVKNKSVRRLATRGKYLNCIGKSVHRIVAIAFIPNPLSLSTVNHKDGNKLNNHVNNLEWASYSENISHRYNFLKKPPGGRWNISAKEKRSISMKGKRVTHILKQVSAIDKNDNVLNFGCIKDASVSLSVSQTSISNCLHKRSKTAGGYKWIF